MTKALLIKTMNTFVIRVYDDKYNFIDYEILHPDLEITITDKDYVFDDLNHTINLNE